MREIKFRAWYEPLAIMVETGAIESINFETKIIGAYIDFDGKGFHKLRTSDFELMQYTGLKDKNGKEIYEGDIVSCTTFSYIEPLERIIATVSYSSRRMSFVFGEKSPLCYRSLDELTNDVYTHEIEIIGNIYENPNLLEG